MNEQKLKTVKQWLEALQESARTAVEALSKDTPLAEDPPSLEERSKNLGAAIHKIRELVRPTPRTVAFLEEEAWYRMKRETKPGEKPDPAAGTGAFFTKPEMLDAVLGNPPLDIPPVAEPIDPNAPKMVRGERSMIGIRSTTSAMIAWNFQDIHIVCDAQRIEEGKWRIVGRANGEERISAIVTGGRWAANVYLKSIRNGMTARARRLKGRRMKAAAAAEPQREVS